MEDSISLDAGERGAGEGENVPSLTAAWMKWLAASGALVLAADLLFFDRPIGLGAAIFGALCLVMVVWIRGRPTVAQGSVMGLAVLGLVQLAVEPNAAGVLFLIALFLALTGAGRVDNARTLPAAVPLGILAYVCSPGRWLLALSEGRQILQRRRHANGMIGGILSILVPVVILVLPLALLVMAGNRLVCDSVAGWSRWLGEILGGIALPEPVRVIFWGFIATGGLVLFRPKIFAAARGVLLQKWPTSRASSVPHSLLRTGAILMISNLILGWANVLDLKHLWVHTSLPAGVTYAEYVHEGFGALVAAGLYSALVLSLLFQGDVRVTSTPFCRSLGVIWSAQGGLLVLNVGRRLKHYVEAYDLSVARIYVGLFLLCMATGFVLLAVRVWRDRSLNWLVGSATVTAFGVLFVAQFIDFKTVVARYNTSQWLAEPARKLDVAYLERLGSAAHASLKSLAEKAPPAAVRVEAAAALEREQDRLRAGGDVHWTGWRLRELARQRDTGMQESSP
ncbi:MAG: DUF4173 domain-containing protein [Opitutaceae bacterium]|nr:DUF4173 domain-containing protein [Opitutaceae bacterium]